MTNIKKWSMVMMALGFLLVTSCRTFVKIPQYTTVKTLSELKPGMAKEDVFTKLGFFPFDAMGYSKENCEIFVYKYKKSFHNVTFRNVETFSGLTEGDRKYDKEGNAYMVFRSNKLESVMTDEGFSNLEALVIDAAEFQATCNNPVRYGCTDPEAVNFDPNANVNDGECEYCPCNYLINPDFRCNKNCEPCIPDPNYLKQLEIERKIKMLECPDPCADYEFNKKMMEQVIEKSNSLQIKMKLDD